MHEPGLDRVAWHLFQRQRSRRVTLQASGLGIAAALMRYGGLAAPASEVWPTEARFAAQGTSVACPAGSETELEVDGEWLCRQPYALCTTAPCERSASDLTTAILPLRRPQRLLHGLHHVPCTGPADICPWSHCRRR